MRVSPWLPLGAVVIVALSPSLLASRRKATRAGSRGVTVTERYGPPGAVTIVASPDRGGVAAPNNPCVRLARLIEARGEDASEYYQLAEDPTPAVLDQCVVEISKLDMSPAERATAYASSRKRDRGAPS